VAAPPSQPIAFKGRGTGWRLAHRFEATQRDGFDDGWAAPADQADEVAPPPRTEVMEERVRSLLSANDSPDIPFEWSINPYRGCEHGCIYCYARPTHSYLNLSPGLDFETKLVAKINAADVLERELARPSHRVSPINIGSATDAYQPVERRLGLTRAVLEVLHRCRHPYTIVTKSSGVERDLDVIAADAAERRAMVFVSVTTMDGDLCRRLEPRAAAPHRRLQTVRTLARAGVPVGVNVAPIIPFLNEPEIERLIEAAAEAGAASIHYTVLRLPWEVNPLFQQWLDQHVPDRAARIMARVRDLRGGADYRAEFGQRMKREGLWAQLIAQRVDKACARTGLARRAMPLDTTAFRPPGDARQAVLF
jgi:DNA repair photolyase